MVVNIDHESKPFQQTYRFNGSDLEDRNSISFRVNDYGTTIDISWSGAAPVGIIASTECMAGNQLISTKIMPKKPAVKVRKSNNKTSFDPISNSNTSILILGTMPGDKSLELGEYYSHKRNRFWRIISTITNNTLPQTYRDKKNLLLNSKIGIWDVAFKVNRKGSLDSAIQNEEPNELDNFIVRHKNLKAIGFNGIKSQSLHDKYFSRKNHIKYLLLPSTSPANTISDFESICLEWEKILNI